MACMGLCVRDTRVGEDVRVDMGGVGGGEECEESDGGLC
jgi:hypothetical protein